MASKAMWGKLAVAAGFSVIHDLDLTDQALPFTTKRWRVAHVWMLLLSDLLKIHFDSSPSDAESGAFFAAVVMTGYAMALDAAVYGVLVLQKNPSEGSGNQGG